MIELRDMKLLDSLARHRHFARAAMECGISQPAFSMRIRNLELDLGVAIVNRGNRFLGLTGEGELVLRWARRLLEDARAMEQDIEAARGVVRGTLTIGCVPTALSFAARLPGRLQPLHPGILPRLLSASSAEIARRIEDGSIDAGITYADGAASEQVEVMPLYEERYVLVSPASMAPRPGGTAAWHEAAEVPLALLVAEMQNRRILDDIFDEIGARAQVLCETNAFSALLVLVREGVAATILPEVLAADMPPATEVVVLPLVEPKARRSVCLVSANRTPVLPTIRALRNLLAAGAQ